MFFEIPDEDTSKVLQGLHDALGTIIKYDDMTESNSPEYIVIANLLITMRNQRNRYFNKYKK